MYTFIHFYLHIIICNDNLHQETKNDETICKRILSMLILEMQKQSKISFYSLKYHKSLQYFELFLLIGAHNAFMYSVNKHD